MAFGDLRGSLTLASLSSSNPSDATGSVSVSVGDGMAVLVSQRSNLNVSAVGDNLGNTYLAQNAGTTQGNCCSRVFYGRVTSAGTITAVSATVTANTNDITIIAGFWEGPVTIPPIDANPANTTTDLSSPFSCPPTGTLLQPVEIVIGCISNVQAQAVAAGGSFTLVASVMSAAAGAASSVAGGMCYLVTSATTTQTPTFTGTNPVADVLHTLSFMAAPAGKAYPPIHRPLRVWGKWV